MCGCGAVRDRFKTQLQKAGLSPKQYLDDVRAAAKRAGYDPKSVEFSDDDKHKLMIKKPDGRIVRFGAVGYKDHLIYTLTKNKDADKYRVKYLKRSALIKGDWKNDKFSPNSLARAITWNEVDGDHLGSGICFSKPAKVSPKPTQAQILAARLAAMTPYERHLMKIYNDRVLMARIERELADSRLMGELVEASTEPTRVIPPPYFSHSMPERTETI